MKFYVVALDETKDEIPDRVVLWPLNDSVPLYEINDSHVSEILSYMLEDLSAEQEIVVRALLDRALGAPALTAEPK